MSTPAERVLRMVIMLCAIATLGYLTGKTRLYTLTPFSIHHSASVMAPVLWAPR